MLQLLGVVHSGSCMLVWKPTMQTQHIILKNMKLWHIVYITVTGERRLCSCNLFLSWAFTQEIQLQPVSQNDQFDNMFDNTKYSDDVSTCD